MEERSQQSQESPTDETQAKTLPPEDVPVRNHDPLERAEPQPQYDAFMRVIRR